MTLEACKNCEELEKLRDAIMHLQLDKLELERKLKAKEIIIYEYKALIDKYLEQTIKEKEGEGETL